GVTQHQPWLGERADQVLGARMIDRRLAADGGVDLRQHGGGELDEVDATHVRGGDEAGHVTDGAPAERQHRRRAVEAGLEQRIPAPLGHAERLGRLAVGNLQGRDREPGLLEALGDGLAVGAEDASRAHERRSRADAERFQPGADARERTALHDDRVGSGAQLDVDVHRGNDPSISLRSTTASTASLVARSTDLRGVRSVESGFMAARTITGWPLVTPPSRPPALLLERRKPLSASKRISSWTAEPGRRAASKPRPSS